MGGGHGCEGEKMGKCSEEMREGRLAAWCCYREAELCVKVVSAKL